MALNMPRRSRNGKGTDALVLDSAALVRVKGAALAELERLNNLDTELVAHLLARRVEVNS